MVEQHKRKLKRKSNIYIYNSILCLHMTIQHKHHAMMDPHAQTITAKENTNRKCCQAQKHMVETYTGTTKMTKEQNKKGLAVKA